MQRDSKLSLSVNAFRDDQPVDPNQSYRPERPAFDEDGQDSHSGLPWGGGDIIGALALSLTFNAVAVFAGALVDALRPSNDSSVPGTTIALIIAVALSFGIVRVTKLPLIPTINLFGLVTLANVVVHVLSDSGETELLGLSASFMEAAILKGVPFGVAWLYVIRKHGRSLRDLGLVAPKSGTAYLIAAGAWVVALIPMGIWAQLVFNVDTISPPDNATPLLEIAGGSLVVAWLLVGLWGPVVEEIFFRGFLLGGLHGRIGRWPALLVSSGIFALFHVDPGLYVPTFLLGLAFGWVYLKTRSVWPAIFAHVLQNSLALFAAWQGFG